MNSTSSFTCPTCGFRFRVDNKFLGRIAACPAEGCGQNMRLNPPPPSQSETNGTAAEPEVAPVATLPTPFSAAPTPPPISEIDAGQHPTPPEFDETLPHAAGSPEAQSAAQARRAQRSVRRRLTAQPAAAVESEHAINPTWIGFGAVVLIALIGWVIWAFVPGEPESTESDGDTQAPAAEPPPIKVEGAPAGVSIPRRSAATLVSFRQPSPQQKQAEEQAAEKAKRRAEKAAVSQQNLKKILPYLNRYCLDCHGPDSQEAGIDVSQLKSVEQFFTVRQSWERIYRMVSAGAMPPSDHDPQPTMPEQEEFAALLHEELFNFDCELVYNPGRPTVQRLNKAEYNNTIRDLFGVNVTPADDFPADDVGDGFDNIGDVLSVPPLLLEKYLNAAEQVTAAVIDTKDYSKPQLIAPKDGQLFSSLNNKDRVAGFLLLVTTGEIIGKFDVPASGEYEIRVELSADQAGDEKARFALRLDSETLGEYDVQEHKKPEKFQRTHQLEAGSHKVAVGFLNDAVLKTGPKDRRDRNLRVRTIELFGPAGGAVPKRSDVHQRIVTAVPGDGLSVQDAAQQVLRPVMERAFRRNITSAELLRYSGLVRSVVDDMGETYESGLSLALQAILVAPDFLFRLEKEASSGESERRLDDFEVASRLSYFLWSSMPDDELFNLARSGKLTDPPTLRQQIQRMLKDEKSAALITNFASQWLNLRNLDDVTPDTDIFKTFNNNLRSDMRRETELLFQTVMREDRSVEELLSADFTFVNKRLAEHYGIKGIAGDKFERVSLKGTNRSGVLTHASILTLTSNPGRTSPVKRGKWIMENIFGEAPPPPPPNIPALEETAKTAPALSLREQLAKHREDPSCASCHKVMDPLGLGLENFDAVGHWRDEDEGRKVDASGSLPSGETFDGPLELIQIVQNRREKFFRTLTEKMLTYAIGRGTQYYDKCAVDQCVDLLKKRGHRFSVLVEGIVLSDPFLKRQGPENSLASQ